MTGNNHGDRRQLHFEGLHTHTIRLESNLDFRGEQL